MTPATVDKAVQQSSKAPTTRRYSTYGPELKAAIRNSFGLQGDKRMMRSYLASTYSWSVRIPDEVRQVLAHTVTAQVNAFASKLGMEGRVVDVAHGLEVRVQFRQLDGVFGDAPATWEALFQAPAVAPSFDAVAKETKRTGAITVTMVSRIDRDAAGNIIPKPRVEERVGASGGNRSIFLGPMEERPKR